MSISCLLLVFTLDPVKMQNKNTNHPTHQLPSLLIVQLLLPSADHCPLIHVQVLRIERVLLKQECKESCFCFRICKSSGPFHIVNDTEELLSFVVSPDPNQLKLTKLAVQVPTKQLMCSSATLVYSVGLVVLLFICSAPLSAIVFASSQGISSLHYPN